MDKIKFTDEASGRAIYQMILPPPVYGTRLYDMEYYGDAVINEALIDIGKERTRPHQIIASSKEYERLVGKPKGGKIFSCRFEVTYEDVNVTVILDFRTRQLILQVDPAIDRQQKVHLAEFYEILTERDYYDGRELEEVEEEFRNPRLYRRIATTAGIVLIAVILLDLTDAFPEFHKLEVTLKWISILVLAAYWVSVEIKKTQLRRRGQKKD